MTLSGSKLLRWTFLRSEKTPTAARASLCHEDLPLFGVEATAHTLAAGSLLCVSALNFVGIKRLRADN